MVIKGTEFLSQNACIARARARDVDRGILRRAEGLLLAVHVTRTVNGTGHTGPSEFCATSL